MAMKRRSTITRPRRAGGAKRRRFNITGRRRKVRGLPGLTVTRTWWASNWTPNTTTVAGYWRYFSSDIGTFPDIASYRGIFEEARVSKIKYTLRPRYTGFDGANTTDTTLPGVTNQGSNDVHVIIDPKSLTVPAGAYTSATLNQFLENGRVKTYSGHRPISFTVKYPCMRDDINGTTNAKARRAMWQDVDRTTQHYGAHVFITDANLTGNFAQSYDIFVTMTVSFRGYK